MKRKHKGKYIFKIIHSDICGPLQTHMHIRCIYFTTLIDDKSRFIIIYLLKHKWEAFEIFKKKIKAQTNKKIKILESNNGGEYKLNDFNIFCQDHGIKRQFTTPYNFQ